MALTGLDQFLKDDQILTGDADIKNYGRDWTKFFTPNAQAIVFPKSTEEVFELVKWARTTKTALVPSGGRTGLSGGAVAIQKEVVVSFEKMNKILSYSDEDRIARVQAGVVTEDLQNFASEKGQYFPVDFAAKGSSHIGGNIATNAGGVKVIRYGLMRDWVSSMTVVTGRGEVMELNNDLIKNASGYDLRHLMIGSEGTLGLVTEASIKFTRKPNDPLLFLVALNHLDNTMDVFKAFRDQTNLLAFEIYDELALQYVLKAQSNLSRPLETVAPFYLLIEVESEGDNSEEKVLSVFESCLEKEWLTDGILSQSDQQSKDLWAIRENITEACAHRTPYKNDVSVKISEVTPFLKDLDIVLKKEYPSSEVVWFGHVGDGNLHISILRPENMTPEEFYKSSQSIDDVVFSKVREYKGSVSAEHGVGIIKKKHLNYTRSEAEISAMKAIKAYFDPDQILNPGKIFD